jgi:hypothetical protein
MANAGLIDRMLRLLDEYEAGRLSPAQVERGIEFHMGGLERIGLREVHEAHNVVHRLASADLSDGVEEFINVEEAEAAVTALRRSLRSLPDGPNA